MTTGPLQWRCLWHRGPVYSTLFGSGNQPILGHLPCRVRPSAHLRILSWTPTISALLLNDACPTSLLLFAGRNDYRAPVDSLLPLTAKKSVPSQQVPSPYGSGFHSMAGVQRIIYDFGGQENGLQFVNDKWNDTILNGNDFTLKWNRTIDTKKAILGVFRVTYPSQGVVVYESLENITSKRSAPPASFK